MRDEEHEEGECAVSVMEPRFAPSYNKQHNTEDGLGHERRLPGPENPPKPGPGMSIADPRHKPPQGDNGKDDGDRRPNIAMDHSHRRRVSQILPIKVGDNIMRPLDLRPSLREVYSLVGAPAL